MECVKIKEMISAYIDDALPEEERAVVEGHIGSCEDCAMFLREIKSTVDRVRDLGEVDPPGWMKDRIMARIKEEETTRKGLRRWLFSPLTMKIPVEAFGVLIAAVAILYVLNTMRTVPNELVPGKAVGPADEVTVVEGRSRDVAPVKEQEKDLLREEAEMKRSSDVSSDAPQPSEGLSGKAEISQKPLKKKVMSPAMKEDTNSVSGAPETHDEKAFSLPGSLPERDDIKLGLGMDKMAGRYEAGEGVLSEDVESRGAGVSDIVSQEVKKADLSLYVDDVRKAMAELERTITELGGEIVERDDGADVITAIIRIPQDKRYVLYDRLRVIGRLSGETVTTAAEDGSMQFTMEIIRK